ncbi:MAG: RlmE family RNA methyltransferase [Candidatus Pacebacteria bacterium]|nr:RlmE family RNA methyltransferase [Candidatus Paceibacterota bacterium]
MKKPPQPSRPLERALPRAYDDASGEVATRPKAVRVRKTGSRTTSSKQWLERQLNDPFVAEAQRLGYRSRAAFKLIQLNERFDLVHAGSVVVDLGAAPGGWSQIAGGIIRPERGGRVIALDILEMESLPGIIPICGDFTDPNLVERLRADLPAGADLVLSDMAEPTMGHARTDHLRILRLAELALDFAESVLRPDGAFVVKLFQGGGEKEILDRLKQGFARVKHAKPAASRKDSAETYVVAQGFRGVG